jgi:hypothetical protein
LANFAVLAKENFDTNWGLYQLGYPCFVRVDDGNPVDFYAPLAGVQKTLEKLQNSAHGNVNAFNDLADLEKQLSAARDILDSLPDGGDVAAARASLIKAKEDDGRALIGITYVLDASEQFGSKLDATQRSWTSLEAAIRDKALERTTIACRNTNWPVYRSQLDFVWTKSVTRGQSLLSKISDMYSPLSSTTGGLPSLVADLISTRGEIDDVLSDIAASDDTGADERGRQPALAIARLSARRLADCWPVPAMGGPQKKANSHSER